MLEFLGNIVHFCYAFRLIVTPYLRRVSSVLISPIMLSAMCTDPLVILENLHFFFVI